MYTSGILFVLLLLLASRAEGSLPLLIGIMWIVLVASLSVSCAACLLPRGYAMRGGRLIAVMIALAGAITALCARVLELRTHELSNPEEVRLNLINAYLGLERTSMFPGGVSRILPVGFLASAWLAWIYMRLRRASHLRQTPLVLFDQDCSGPSADDGVARRPSEESRSPSPETVLASVREHVCTAEFMATADTVFQTPILPYFVLLAGIGLLSFVPVVYDGLIMLRGQTFEWWFFDLLFGMFFLGMVFLILLRLSWLLTLWSSINQALRSIMHLPMRMAFDRLPRRVARWFFEVTSGKDGPETMLYLQARALGAAIEDPTRDAVLLQASASDQINITSQDLCQLRAALAGNGNDSRGSLQSVLNLLCGLWRGLSLSDAFAERGEMSEATKANPWMNAPRLRTLNDSDREHLARVATLAEDYVAVHFVRWLGLIMDHVWGTINFLAIAVPALLLAVSSYPFISQGRLLMGISVIVAATVLVILIVVIGLNRDELVSLASSTKPHGLSLDHGLVMSLLTYVVPLLFGIAFAISYDLSDVLKSMLDPLFRMMD
jgi:hypothetical protein